MLFRNLSSDVMANFLEKLGGFFRFFSAHPTCESTLLHDSFIVTGDCQQALSNLQSIFKNTFKGTVGSNNHLEKINPKCGSPSSWGTFTAYIALTARSVCDHVWKTLEMLLVCGLLPTMASFQVTMTQDSAPVPGEWLVKHWKSTDIYLA